MEFTSITYVIYHSRWQLTLAKRLRYASIRAIWVRSASFTVTDSCVELSLPIWPAEPCRSATSFVPVTDGGTSCGLSFKITNAQSTNSCSSREVPS